MVGILVSFWEGPFSGPMLVPGRVVFVDVSHWSFQRITKTSHGVLWLDQRAPETLQ